MMPVRFLSKSTPSRLLKCGLRGATLIAVRLLQPGKAGIWIVATLAGMKTEVRAVQLANASFAIAVTPCPMETVARREQSRNTLAVMDCTLPGMVMEARLVQPRNACESIPVTPWPIRTEARLVQSWNALCG